MVAVPRRRSGVAVPFTTKHNSDTDMVDMIVRLYDLPDGAPLRAALAEKGVTLRLCNPYERHCVVDFVGRHFSPKWVSECKVAMGHQPIGCFIATRNKEILGFVCVDTTARGFIGPMGVSEKARGLGLGKALFVTGLEQLRNLGYAYGIVGGAGPVELYKKWVDAVEIPKSTPGIYADLLPDTPPNE